jgi:hypothetical protein
MIDPRHLQFRIRSRPFRFALSLSVALALVLPVQAQPTTVATSRPTEPDRVVVDQKTQEVIDSALKWLASKQLGNGSFSNGSHQAAITAYALLAFMSTGSTAGEGPYGKAVQSGQDFLLQCVRGDGYIAAPAGESNMYGHGISCVVLGELYGQSKDPSIRPKLQRAIKLIVSCQNKDGGWRYRPVPLDADISVTVLQVVALRVAKNAGLDVPQETIDRAVAYVKSCNDKASGGFYYQREDRAPGFARTAAALYSLQVCGLYDDPLVPPGQKYLFDHRGEEVQWFTYGNFYAAPVMYMIGGDTWRQWYGYITAELLRQIKREANLIFWDGTAPATPVWTTAVNVTILAMPYHYVPLYQR